MKNNSILKPNLAKESKFNSIRSYFGTLKVLQPDFTPNQSEQLGLL